MLDRLMTQVVKYVNKTKRSICLSSVVAGARLCKCQGRVTEGELVNTPVYLYFFMLEAGLDPTNF